MCQVARGDPAGAGGHTLVISRGPPSLSLSDNDNDYDSDDDNDSDVCVG